MTHEPIHELIRQTSVRFPDHTAIDWREDRIKYRELDAAAENLADTLVAAGVPPGSLVGILAGRSVDVITSMLAVLKAGCAYVPVDPEFQVARLEAIAAEARPRCWLVEPRHAGHLESLRREHGLDEPVISLNGIPASRKGTGVARTAAAQLGPEDLSYVYFTSGSTGRPKGIAGRLKAIDHYVRWMNETFAVGEGTRFSQLISPAWDGFMLDAFVPLAAGGTVCVPDDRETLLDGARLRNWMNRRRVNLIHCTPSLFRQVLNQELAPADFPELRCVLLVGEPLLPSDVRRWYAIFGDRVQLVNLYGPTETTLTKLFHLVTPEDAQARSIAIGKPMPGARVIVVDEGGTPCPPGKVGEIYIRTPYRALGYLNQPELTAEVFITNPFSGKADDIVYKTGDLGRMREDGSLEFLGRRDGQIKIRGMRIELAPVEDLLRSQGGVADVAVAARDDAQGNKFLCAYIVPRSEIAVAQLAEACRAGLPEAMVPSAFVLLEALPRTLTGKVDRKALPDPNQAQRLAREYVAPRTPVEAELCTLFSDLLGAARVGIRDNFFELGGHSLLATLLLSRVRSSLNIEMPLRQLFESPTVEGLAATVARLKAGSEGGDRELDFSGRAGKIVAQPPSDGPFPLSFSQQRLWFIDQMEGGSHFYNISSAVRLIGPLRVGLLRHALDEVVWRHESLRTVLAGPDGEPWQRVKPSYPAALSIIDLQHLAGGEQALRRLLQEEVRRSFDLARGPLFRCVLVRLTEHEHVMLCVVHHIIADWWSLKVLIRELTLLYDALLRGEPSPLPELPIQFRDFVVWQQRWLQGDVLEEQISYWRRQLAGAPAFLELPTDLPRPEIQTFRGGQQRLELPAGVAEALETLCSAEGCSLFMVLLACYQILLAHRTGQDDVVVGVPISLRDQQETERLIGFLVNTLLFRTDLSGDPTLRELLARVRGMVMEAYAHKHMPLERVIEEVAPARSLSHSPLLQVGMNFVDDRSPASDASGLLVESFGIDLESVQFELNLVMVRSVAGLEGYLQYKLDLFTEARVQVLVDELALILAQAGSRPDIRLSDLRGLLTKTGARREAPLAAEPERVQGIPLSIAQERLWRLRQGETDAPYRVVCRVAIEGGVVPGRLDAALRRVVARHEILRTVFRRLPGLQKPLQVILNDADTRLRVLDLGDLPASEREAVVERLFNDLYRGAGSPEKESALHAVLVLLAPARSVLLLALSSLCADAVTLENLMRDLARDCQSPADTKEPPPTQYADFAQWHQDFLESEAAAPGGEHWRRLRESIGAQVTLPFERTAGTPPFNPRRLPLPPDLVVRAEALARRNEAGVEAVLLGIWQILLGRLARRSQVVIGVLHQGRKFVELEEAMGPYAEYLPFLCKLPEDLPFKQAAERVRAVLGEMDGHQESFDWRDLASPETGSSPLFPFCFELVETPSPRAAGEMLFSMESRSVCTDRFELKLACLRGPSPTLEIHYDAALFAAADVERLGGWLQALLDGLLEWPERPIGTLELLTVSERRLLADLNATGRDLGPAENLDELFEAQADRTPDRVAIAFGDQELTFAELEVRANHLARYLRRAGGGPDIRIALFIERSFQMVLGMLGILKAGSAYVPLDPSYPEDRRAFMLENASPLLVLTQESLLPLIPRAAGCRALCLDRDWTTIAMESPQRLRSVAGPENLAYGIYTSGSTGRPKGVMVSHGAIANRLLWMQRVFPLTADDRLLQKTLYSFDASVWEVFLPLLAGARLVVAEPGVQQDPGRLVSAVAEEEITVLQLVPSLLAVFLAQAGVEEACRSLSRLFCGGEALSRELAQRWADRVGTPLCNLYGPTEVAIDASFHDSDSNLVAATVPIGRPLDNVEVHLLDEGGRLVPPGLDGELYVGGAGLARGYLGRPDLTAERFVPDPWSGRLGSRLYRTGDLARLDRHGDLHFRGRIDRQVKVRGFRIEPGEVEAALLRHPAVLEAAVTAREDAPGDSRLVAYTVFRRELRAEGDDLRAFLAARVPDFMVPSAFVTLRELPRLPNGKLNRASLPAPDIARPGLRQAFVAPRTPAEEILAGIWAETLNLERVGVHDNFFDLGGHSLVVTRVVSRVREAFHIDLPVRKLFELPTVAGLALEVERALKSTESWEVPPLRPVSREQDLPLSFAQQRLWFLQELEPQSPAYNIPGALRLAGALDRAALERSIQEIVHRHESLRTTFRNINGEPVQIVLPPPSAWWIPVVDFTSLPATDRTAAALDLIAREALRPFDLATGPLLRVVLLRLGEREHVLSFSLHHIVSDGWSVGVLVRELSVLYGGFVRREPANLPELPIQYVDYVYWQREWLQGPILEGLLTYWRGRLKGAPEVLNLATDRPHPSVQTYRGGTRSRLIPSELKEGLLSLSRSASATLFTTLLAAFKTLLQRYGAGDDIVVGTNAANRNNVHLEGLIGFFVNALVLRTDLAGDPPFRDFLDRARETVLGAFAHQELPFDRIVEELQPRRDLSVTPLFQIVFDMDPVGDAARIELTQLEVATLPFASQSAKFDLNLTVEDREQDLLILAEFSSDVLDSTTVDRMLLHFKNLLRSIVVDPGSRLRTLPLLGEAETFQLLSEFQGPERVYPVDQSIQRLFEAQAASTPDRVAAVHGDVRLTYAALDRCADRLAALLRRLDVRPGHFVGIFEERGLDFLLALLAILKAGGAYVPFEPSYPEDRLRYMIDNSGIATLLTRAELASAKLATAVTGRSTLASLVCFGPVDAAPPFEAAGLRVEPFDPRAVDAPPEVSGRGMGGDPRDPAYMLYTSGSTGLPKGAVIRHDGAVNHIYAQFEALRLGPELRFLQSAPSSSDISVWQFLAPLLSGGSTVIVDIETVSDPVRLLRVLREERVTLIELVPVVLRGLLDHAAGLSVAERALPDLRWMMATGEAVPVDLVNAWLTLYPQVPAVNAYGPTEAADDVTQLVLGRPLPGDVHSLSIGRPLANFNCYVVDAGMGLLPIGVPGELCIAGIGVGSGYWRNPEKTSLCFFPNPFARAAGEVLYRTGDLARWKVDGTLEFLGRIDHQVKVRGFRIELGEVEAALLAHPGVREGVVVVREETGEKRLVAYLVPAEDREEVIAEVRQLLQQRLPGHMVPSAFVCLPSMPRTPNGKVDRRALPAPGRSDVQRPGTPPRTPVERRLAEIWAEVFKIDHVAADIDFFQLGGHSLLATRMLARVQSTFGVEIPLRKVFESTTVASLARVVEEAGQTPAKSRMPAVQRVMRKTRIVTGSEGMIESLS